jgi:hypothetical protein
MTPQITDVLNRTLDTMRKNQEKSWGRFGEMVSGASGMGKTTSVLTTAKAVYEDHTRRFPDYKRDGHIPVVFVSVPPGSTGKSMMGRFADFLGFPVRKADTMEQLKRMVIPQLNAKNTRLIIVDEFQNLATHSHGNGETVDVLKDLSNDTKATFIYSGINIHTGGVLSGERGQQIAGRFRVRRLTRYPFSTVEHRKQWKGVVAGFERELHLLNQPAGSLVKHAQYLHDRTNGVIGPLNRLLLEAAQISIANSKAAEDEFLTLALMDSVDLDIATEEAASWYRSTDDEGDDTGRSHNAKAA